MNWLIIIQRNPPGMTTAVMQGTEPPGTIRLFGVPSMFDSSKVKVLLTT